MPLAKIVAAVRAGIVQISFFNAPNERVGGGTGFLARGRLLTNHHVFLGHRSANSIQLKRDGGHPVVLSPDQFEAALCSGSMENSFDFAILSVPQLFDGLAYQFDLELPGGRRIGDQIAILGFPLEHENLTVHTGIVSSFYQKKLAQIIQLDASINAGNSGGPLIDPQSGAVFGIVTRRATGLTASFNSLQKALHTNIQLAQQSTARMRVGSFDAVQAFIAGQHQILTALTEIERQANVGIGYAISIEHVMSDARLPNA